MLHLGEGYLSQGRRDQKNDAKGEIYVLTLPAELSPSLESKSAQDGVVLRILRTKLLYLLTLKDQSGAEEPSPDLCDRRIKVLVWYLADPVTTSILTEEAQDEPASELYDLPRLEGER